MGKRIKGNWQQILFVVIGLGIIALSIRFLVEEKATMAATAFAMAFLCFVSANFLGSSVLPVLGLKRSYGKISKKKQQN